MGKPDTDIFIDDKAINDSFWLWKNKKLVMMKIEKHPNILIGSNIF